MGGEPYPDDVESFRIRVCLDLQCELISGQVVPAKNAGTATPLVGESPS